MAVEVCVTAADGIIGYAIVQHLATFCTCERREENLKGVPITEASKAYEILSLCDTLVLVPPSHKDKVDYSDYILEEAVRAKVKNMMLISMAVTDMANEQQHPQLAKFQQIETAVKKHKHKFENFLILRINYHTQNLFLYKAQMKEGKLPLPIKEGKFAPTDLSDLCEVIGIILSKNKWEAYNGQLITITGPESLDGKEIAERVSKALESKIEWDDISNEESKKILSDSKLIGETEIDLLNEFYDLVKAQRADFVTAHQFKSLTGRNSSTIEDFITYYMDEFSNSKGKGKEREDVTDELQSTIEDVTCRMDELKTA